MTHHTNNKLIQYDAKRCRRLHTKNGETRCQYGCCGDSCLREYDVTRNTKAGTML